MSFIDYRTGTWPTVDDSGFANDVNSIQPVLDGDIADASNLGRPSENLRSRSDILRDAVNAHDAVMLQDRSMLMVQAKTSATPMAVTFNSGTGKFTTTGSVDGVLIIPSASAMKNNGGVLTDNPHTAKLYYDDGAGTTFTLRANKQVMGVPTIRHMWEGTDNIYFTMRIDAGVPAHTPVITITGATDPMTGPVEIDIAVSDDGVGGTLLTMNELIAGINAHATAKNYIYAELGGLAVDGVIPAGMLAVTGTRSRLYEFPTYGVGGLDAPVRQITAAMWAAAPALAEGDILALDFSTITERRQNNLLTPATLVKVSELEHTNVGNNQIFPLVKIYNGDAYFFNGIKAKNGIATTLEHDYPNRSAFVTHTASATLDAHVIRNIKRNTRPFVVVGNTTGCDYPSITTAMTDANIVASGGTIYVCNGTYPEGALAFGSKPVTIVGESRSGVFINLSDAWNFTTGQPHHFENLTFRADATAVPAMFTSTVGASLALDYRTIQFVECVFERTGPGPMAGVAMFYVGQSISFYRCIFDGAPNGTQNYDDALRPHDLSTTILPSGASSQMTVVMEHCHFKECRHVFYNADPHVMALVRIVYCTMEYCGYASAGTFEHLITNSNASAGGRFEVCHNVWRDSGTDNSQSGGFCKIRGQGEIANNSIGRVPRVAHAIEAYMIDCADRILIRNNYILNSAQGATPALGFTGVGGIRGRNIFNNVVENFAPTIARQYGISAIESNAKVHANRVTFDTDIIATPNVAPPVVAGSVGISVGISGGADIIDIYRTKIENNHVLGVRDGCFGIVVRGADAKSSLHEVSDNFISGDSSTPGYTVGIVISTRDTLVSNNSTSFISTAIDVANITGLATSGVNIVGNRFSGDSSGYNALRVSNAQSSYDISITGNHINSFGSGINITVLAGAITCYHVLIANNYIKLSTGGTYAIRLSATGAADAKSSIVGNFIAQTGAAAAQGILLTNCRYVGVGGNFITTGFTNEYSISGCTNVGMSDNPPNDDTDPKLHNWTLI